MSAPRRRAAGLWLAWVLAGVALAVGLVIGTSRNAAPLSLDARVRAIASDIRCPSCSDLTAAQSNAETAVAVRSLIRQQLQAGRSPSQIQGWLASRYGRDILLRPPARGLAALVWVLPPLAAVLGLLAVYLGLRRWSARPGAAPPAEEDRRLVEEALGR